MTTKKQKLSDVAKTLQMTPNDLIALFLNCKTEQKKRAAAP